MQQQNPTANTIQQLGSLVQTAAPLIVRGVSALAGAASGGGDAGGATGIAGDFPAVRQQAQSPKPSYRTLEHRPEDSIGSIPMQTLEMEYDPSRPPARPVPLSAGTDEKRTVHPVDMHGLRQLENYWNDV